MFRRFVPALIKFNLFYFSVDTLQHLRYVADVPGWFRGPRCLPIHQVPPRWYRGARSSTLEGTRHRAFQIRRYEAT